MFGPKLFRVRRLFVLGGAGQLCYRSCYRSLQASALLFLDVLLFHSLPHLRHFGFHALQQRQRTLVFP